MRKRRTGGGWQSVDEEQWGDWERGAQFTEAALNQPITVKENISWCVSSLRKKEWKARRASAYESYRNKYKAVSRAETDMWLVPSSSSAHGFQCEWICLRAYVEACQINRLKGERVGGTGQDFVLRAQLFFFFFFFLHLTVWLRVRSEMEGEQCVCLHVCRG